MAFHETQRRRFLQQSAIEIPAPDRLLTPVTPYAVRVEPAQVTGDTSCWRLLGVYHLSPDENRGGHQVFIDVVDEQGVRVPLGGATVRWGWEGQRADETAPPRPLDKPEPEPAAVIDVFGGQHVWVEIAGDNLPSDRVANLHTGHADEPGSGGEIWNSWGHHSFYLLF